MSRQIDLTIPQAVPRNERQWRELGERLESLWLASGRKPLGGPVAMSFFWEDYRDHSIEDEAEIALELAARIDFMLRQGTGTRLYIGQARCEKASQNRLRIVVSERADGLP